MPAEPCDEQPSCLSGRMVDPPVGIELNDRSTRPGVAVPFERREKLSFLSARERFSPKRLDVRPEHERELPVPLVEVSILAVEREPTASRRLTAADTNAERVHDAELGVARSFVPDPFSLAASVDIGRLVDRGAPNGHVPSSGPEALGDVWR